ncbi:hypothetical protein BGZ61DRAFT_39023 [Ilyonectria robusta]|uniref:uncharacterized protein n=1 Tax=Ilyonectria robusta TaxID=1079257 RepID=UPI001E8D7810|nr:uncharacterized protein BGZ61DRAFT_39023 [Ilyonectria robusta]KAH8688122.1 hypothetical protein BGZ61DRAFT_39023 [Ilyonectria robusta]
MYGSPQQWRILNSSLYCSVNLGGYPSKTTITRAPFSNILLVLDLWRYRPLQRHPGGSQWDCTPSSLCVGYLFILLRTPPMLFSHRSGLWTALLSADCTRAAQACKPRKAEFRVMSYGAAGIEWFLRSSCKGLVETFAWQVLPPGFAGGCCLVEGHVTAYQIAPCSRAREPRNGRMSDTWTVGRNTRL